MRIMLNITCYNSAKATGIERFALNIAKEICKIEPKATVVSSGKISGIPSSIISRLLAFSHDVFKKSEYLIRTIWDQTWFRLIVATRNPDIVFFPIQDGMLFPPCKQIITVHDFDVNIPECRQEINRFRTRLYHTKMPHILRCSVAVIAVSEFTKQGIANSFDINPDKIHVIHNGYDEQRFRVIDNPQPILDSYGLKSGKYFLFVGSILKHKNIISLVQAFAQLESKFTLVIAGVCKDAPYLGEIDNVAAGFGFSKNQLRYLDYVSDDNLPYLYNGAIACVLPSFHEGFGIPIIEAMACGTPVITSNCSAMPEVAGDAAILVDPYSVESIATAMREVLNNPQRVDSMKMAGMERAKMFRWSCSAQKLYDLCKSVSKA